MSASQPAVVVTLVAAWLSLPRATVRGGAAVTASGATAGGWVCSPHHVDSSRPGCTTTADCGAAVLPAGLVNTGLLPPTR